MLTPQSYKYLVYYSKVYFYLKTLNLISVSLWIILIKHLPSLKLDIDTNLTQSKTLKFNSNTRTSKCFIHFSLYTDYYTNIYKVDILY